MATGVILAAVTAVAGWSSTTQPAAAAPARDDLILVFGAPPTFDYLTSASTAIQGVLMYNTIEPLLEQTEDGSLAPLLAESYEVNDAGTEYIFTIREAVFHDGSDVSADDVVYSLELNMASDVALVSAPFEAVESIEKVDDRTVAVSLSRPSRAFIQEMASTSGFIIPEGSAELLQQSPVGSGPFVFESWTPGVEIVQTRFDDYWGAAPPLRQVVWRDVPVESRYDALRAGDADVTRQASAGEVEQFRTTNPEGLTAVQLQGSQMMWLFLNAEDPVLEDERVRQAIAHSIDREEILAGVGDEYSTPACLSVNRVNSPWNSDYCPYEHDPERASELIAEVTQGAGLELDFKTLNSQGTAAEILIAQMAAAGITARNTPLELATFLDEALTRGQYQVSFVSGSQPITNFAAACPATWTRDCTPEIGELLAQADATLDEDEWIALNQQAAELLAERAYLIPMWNQPAVTLVDSDLQGIKAFSVFTEYDLRNISWS